MVPRTETSIGSDIRRTLHFSLGVSFALSFLATPSYPQNATSTLLDLVTDSSNAIVPGVWLGIL